jgi:hypothetical protein
MTPMRVLAIAFVCLNARSEGQNLAKPAAAPLGVCEILAHPLQYDGKLVTIRGRVGSTDEGVWIFSDGCRGVLTTDGYTWPSEIAVAMPTAPPPLRLHSIDFEYDSKSRQKVVAKYKSLRRRWPERCLVMTDTGLFETRDDWSKAKMEYPNGTWKFAGFGHLGEAPGQLILKSEDDVSVVPSCAGKDSVKKE